MLSPSRHLISGGQDDPFLPFLIDAINNSSHIEIAVAFIKRSGLRLIQPALQDAMQRGAEIFLVTGDYLDVTEPEALRDLLWFAEMGADIRVFQSEGKTSVHLKTYIFCDLSRDGIAQNGVVFVGSSNMTETALLKGIEWNLRIWQEENEERFVQIRSRFLELIQHPMIVPLSDDWIDEYARRRANRKVIFLSEEEEERAAFIPEPTPIQKDALYALDKTRKDGFQKGLIVMATGLGKTWLAAFDMQAMEADRVLFLAHREEILDQAASTFGVLRPDATRGHFTGERKAHEADILFASVQTLAKSRYLNAFSEDYFDYIIVDEFHHAAAATYRKILSHFRPKFLLGLTATPHRSDQFDLLRLCDQNLVFNRDLFDGIESKLLSPFHYFGIADDESIVDYSEIPWRNGKFDPHLLEVKLATELRARHVFHHWQQHKQACTLAFCLSKKHADFMSSYFTKRGVRSASVHSDSEMRRNQALELMRQGELDVVFSVDLFNEGVDLPRIDTVLMLRPTESKILFLQQLGRGLRLEKDKQHLVVLDFIGNHTSFFKTVEILLNENDRRKGIERLLDKNGQVQLPNGCFVNFDPQAIDFMQRLYRTRLDAQKEIYQSLRDTYGRRPTMGEFFLADGNLSSLRSAKSSWFHWVQAQGDLQEAETYCLQSHEEFFRELETSAMSKSFKMILLKAFIELDGFVEPPIIEALSDRSFRIMCRHRNLHFDLPERYLEYVNTEETPNEWSSYWRQNPIRAWTGEGRKQEGFIPFFVLEKNKFCYRQTIQPEMIENFYSMLDEIIELRLMQYETGKKDV